LYITNNYINIFGYEYENELKDCLLVFPNKNDIYFVYSYYIFGSTGYYSDEIEHFRYSGIKAKLLFSNNFFYTVR